jgi:hypothetical protein
VVILLGFLLFLFPKLFVVGHVRRISFGTALMTEGQANAYRVGCSLMGFGYLLTFLWTAQPAGDPPSACFQPRP